MSNSKAYPMHALDACPYCDQPVPIEHVTRDHFVPRAAGGTLCNANRVLACDACNQLKAALRFATIEEARDYVRDRRARLRIPPGVLTLKGFLEHLAPLPPEPLRVTFGELIEARKRA